jgi:lysophospholipase L1-like esterase
MTGWLGVLAGALLIASCAIKPPAPAPTGQAPTTGQIQPGDQPTLQPLTAPIAGAPQGIDRLYSALDRLRASTPGGSTQGTPDKLRVLLLGDSHVAGGIITQRLRERFQADFGDAGRGPMVPGLPYAGRREADWKLTQTGDWSYENSLRPNALGPFGLSGFLARSRNAGAGLSISAMNTGFDEAEISFLRRPGGGSLDVLVDDQRVSRIETKGDRLVADRLVVPTAPGSRRLDVRAVDRQPVDLLTLGIEKKERGVIVEGHGISGATAGVMGKWDQTLLADDLRRRDPALILLAFGTNEGFQASFDPNRYTADYAALIRLIQDAAPRAALVLVGPPDAARRSRATASSRGCDWTTPPNLLVVRATQRELAARMGVLFWDWSELMKGPCGVHEWVTAKPPLARPDHVHLTHPGYTTTADALYQDLVGPYLMARLGAAKPLRH